MKKRIFLQKIGPLNDDILVKLKPELKITFGNYIKSVKILSDEFPLIESEYNLEQRSYNAKPILDRLETYVREKNYYKLLGIMDKDIYSGKRVYIFGIARNSVAIISITRLLERFYSKTENKELEHIRVLKEAIHELGHSFGLKHCKNHCVMRISERTSNVDEKPSHFCVSCIESLKKLIR